MLVGWCHQNIQPHLQNVNKCHTHIMSAQICLFSPSPFWTCLIPTGMNLGFQAANVIIIFAGFHTCVRYWLVTKVNVHSQPYFLQCLTSKRNNCMATERHYNHLPIHLHFVSFVKLDRYRNMFQLACASDIWDVVDIFWKRCLVLKSWSSLEMPAIIYVMLDCHFS